MSVVGEWGTTSVDHTWRTVDLDAAYENPVVVAFVRTSNGTEFVDVRLRNVEGDRFEIRLQEGDHLDGITAVEEVSFMVVEAGRHVLANGAVIEAGTVDTFKVRNQSIDQGATEVDFAESGADKRVFATVNTYNGKDFVTARVDNVTDTGFDVSMAEIDAKGAHGYETIGWIAIDDGAFDGFSTAAMSVDEVAKAASGLAGNVDMAQITEINGRDAAVVRVDADGEVFIQEETSLDAETFHAFDTVSMLSFDTDAGVFEAAAATVLSAEAQDHYDAAVRLIALIETHDPAYIADMAARGVTSYTEQLAEKVSPAAALQGETVLTENLEMFRYILYGDALNAAGFEVVGLPGLPTDLAAKPSVQSLYESFASDLNALLAYAPDAVTEMAARVGADLVDRTWSQKSNREWGAPLPEETVEDLLAGYAESADAALVYADRIAPLLNMVKGESDFADQMIDSSLTENVGRMIEGSPSNMPSVFAAEMFAKAAFAEPLSILDWPASVGITLSDEAQVSYETMAEMARLVWDPSDSRGQMDATAIVLPLADLLLVSPTDDDPTAALATLADAAQEAAFAVVGHVASGYWPEIPEVGLPAFTAEDIANYDAIIANLDSLRETDPQAAEFVVITLIDVLEPMKYDGVALDSEGLETLASLSGQMATNNEFMEEFKAIYDAASLVRAEVDTPDADAADDTDDGFVFAMFSDSDDVRIKDQFDFSSIQTGTGEDALVAIDKESGDSFVFYEDGDVAIVQRDTVDVGRGEVTTERGASTETFAGYVHTVDGDNYHIKYGAYASVNAYSEVTYNTGNGGEIVVRGYGEAEVGHVGEHVHIVNDDGHLIAANSQSAAVIEVGASVTARQKDVLPGISVTTTTFTEAKLGAEVEQGYISTYDSTTGDYHAGATAEYFVGAKATVGNATHIETDAFAVGGEQSFSGGPSAGGGGSLGGGRQGDVYYLGGFAKGHALFGAKGAGYVAVSTDPVAWEQTLEELSDTQNWINAVYATSAAIENYDPDDQGPSAADLAIAAATDWVDDNIAWW